MPRLSYPRSRHVCRRTTDLEKGMDWMLLDDRGHWKIESLACDPALDQGNGVPKEMVSDVVKHHWNGTGCFRKFRSARSIPAAACGIVTESGLPASRGKGNTPTRKMILDHVGSGLTPYLDDWCELNGITTGGQYLMWWAARLFQYPQGRLPYLFLFSPEQNSGKSSFHRTLLLLFANQNGWCELRKELLKDDFNDLLRGCSALAYLEEIDLSKSPMAYDLVKNLIDGLAQGAGHLPSLRDGSRLRSFHPPGESPPLLSDLPRRQAHHGDPRPSLHGRRHPVGGQVAAPDRRRAAGIPARPAELEDAQARRWPFVSARIDDAGQDRGVAAREAEGWYGQLKLFAAADQIKSLEANVILQKLAVEITDSRMPKSAGGSAQNSSRWRTSWQRTASTSLGTATRPVTRSSSPNPQVARVT